MIQYIIYSLTCLVWDGIWHLCANVSPRQYHETRLTYLYIVISRKPRIAPNGSHKKWLGYASKWAHPP